MSVNAFVLTQGLSDTRSTLRRWRHDPGPVLRSWVLGAVGVACVLLVAVTVVASVEVPDPSGLYIVGISGPAGLGDLLEILARNSIVLALHATACIAGFIAGRSLVLSAQRRSGLSRWVHERARPIALGWVVLVTCFSLITQAYALGLGGATLSGQLGISPVTLALTVLPHALPELTALFLPLAAWTIASRRDEWHELLAATGVTTALAIPVLVGAAAWEVYAWPTLLRAASPLL